MKIGLISDTHTPAFGKEPPPQVAEVFRGVDLIIHAGDIYASSCLDWLEKFAPVFAVENGGRAWAGGDPRVEEKRVEVVEGFRIGMVHDLALNGINEVFPQTLARSFPEGRGLASEAQRFFDSPVDIVVFGHTHFEMVEEHGGILFVNPGSPNLPKHVQTLGFVGILELTPNGPTAKIIDLTKL